MPAGEEQKKTSFFFNHVYHSSKHLYNDNENQICLRSEKVAGSITRPSPQYSGSAHSPKICTTGWLNTCYPSRMSRCLHRLQPPPQATTSSPNLQRWMSSDRKWTDENVFDQHCNLWCNTGAALANLLYCGFNEEPTSYNNKADYCFFYH